LMAVKLGYFFGEPGVRLNVDAYGHREIGGVLTRLPFAFAFLAAFGLAGLAVALFKGRSEGLLGMAAVIVWVLSVVLFFVTDQYRQVAAPLLAAGSGMGIFYAGEALFRRRWLTGSSMIVVSVLLLFLTSRNWNGYEMDRVFEMLNDANALSTAGRDDEAQKLYAEIIEMPLTWQLRGERSANVFELSSAAKAANALAVQDFRKRDWRSAEQRYSLSLAWQPDYEVMGNYGVCLLALGRMPEAVRIFEESLKGQPFAEHTRLYYAEALFKSGRRAAAIDELKRLAQSKSEFGIKARSQLEKLERE